MLWKNKEFAKPHELSGWRAWRIRIEQPGVWMIHCHLLPHMVFGMQTVSSYRDKMPLFQLTAMANASQVWVMGNSSQVLAVDQPDVEGYLNYGGSVYGNKTHAPEVVHYFTNWTQTQ
jgi:L-ascorbate oxidase